jgi:hypothetical protein
MAFRFTILDLLWLTVVVAVITAFAMEWRRARQKYIDSVTCGPNTLRPSDVWPNGPPSPN